MYSYTTVCVSCFQTECLPAFKTNRKLWIQSVYVWFKVKSGPSQLPICRPLPPPLTPALRNGHICMKEAQCAEANEKSILQFLVFELLSEFLTYFDYLTKIAKINFCLRRWAMFWNGFMYSLDSFAIFSFWDMVNFVLKMPSELETLRTWFRNANQGYPIASWLGGLNPKVFGGYGALKPPTNKGV